MNGTGVIKAVGFAGLFLARHVLAFAAVVIGAALAWTLTYFGLLLWAVLTDGGIGGPLAYPAGLVFMVAASALCCLVLLLPSTVLAEGITRWFGFSTWVQIPVSTGLLVAFSFVSVLVIAAAGVELSPLGVPVWAGILFLLMLVPLGVYWWSLQAVPLVVSLARRIRRAFQQPKLDAGSHA